MITVQVVGVGGDPVLNPSFFDPTNSSWTEWDVLRRRRHGLMLHNLFFLVTQPICTHHHHLDCALGSHGPSESRIIQYNRGKHPSPRESSRILSPFLLESSILIL